MTAWAGKHMSLQHFSVSDTAFAGKSSVNSLLIMHLQGSLGGIGIQALGSRHCKQTAFLVVFLEVPHTSVQLKQH